MSEVEETALPPRRILVVDDDTDLLILVGSLLRSEGYVVDTAANARECAEKLNESLPDLILLDIMMPGVDGMQMSRKLKAHPRTASIPIMFLTAVTEKKSMQSALFELGVEFYVTKPFDPDDLLDKVHQAIRYNRLGK